MKSAIQLLKERGLRAKKALGQNFLLDTNVCERIANAAVPLTPRDGGDRGRALEIGPGLGALTRPLLDRTDRLVVIERDRELAAVLRDEHADAVAADALEIIEGDALEVDWSAILDQAPDGRWSLVGNLPYLITGRLIETAIHLADRIERAVFMVQAEVADRLVAKPGGDAYGALSVFTQAAFTPTKLLTVKGGAFHPRPEVDSTVVVFTPRRPRAAVEDQAFQAVVKAAFHARRKTLRNAWRGLFDPATLDALPSTTGVDLGRRGETLDVAEFDRVAAALRTARTPD